MSVADYKTKLRKIYTEQGYSSFVDDKGKIVHINFGHCKTPSLCGGKSRVPIYCDYCAAIQSRLGKSPWKLVDYLTR